MRNIANTIPESVVLELKRRLEYCPDTGNLTWKEPAKYSRAKRGCIAGAARNYKNQKSGYRYFKTSFTGGKSIAVHRIAWLLHYGSIDDEKCIDHIDGNPSNNAIRNLRLVSSAVNAQNVKRANKTSSSGLPGTYWHKRVNKWTACIGIYDPATGKSRRKNLGYFPDKESAYQAYLEAKRRLHPGNTL